MVVVESRLAGANGGQTKNDGQEDLTTCLMRLVEIIYYELLSYGQTPNLNQYCQRLDRLKEEITYWLPAVFVYGA